MYTKKNNFFTFISMNITYRRDYQKKVSTTTLIYADSPAFLAAVHDRSAAFLNSNKLNYQYRQCQIIQPPPITYHQWSIHVTSCPYNWEALDLTMPLNTYNKDHLCRHRIKIPMVPEQFVRYSVFNSSTKTTLCDLYSGERTLNEKMNRIAVHVIRFKLSSA